MSKKIAPVASLYRMVPTVLSPKRAVTLLLLAKAAISASLTSERNSTQVISYLSPFLATRSPTVLVPKIFRILASVTLAISSRSAKAMSATAA